MKMGTRRESERGKTKRQRDRETGETEKHEEHQKT